MTKPLEIPIDIIHEVILWVYPSSSNAKLFEEVEPQDGESRWQLVEGEEYEYAFEGVSLATLMKYVIHNPK